MCDDILPGGFADGNDTVGSGTDFEHQFLVNREEAGFQRPGSGVREDHGDEVVNGGDAFNLSLATFGERGQRYHVVGGVKYIDALAF